MRTKNVWWKKPTSLMCAFSFLCFPLVNAQTIMEFEAESTTDFHGMEVQDHSGFSGGKGIGGMQVFESSYARYVIPDVPMAGTYSLDIHYGTMQPRYAYIKIGEQLPTLVFFNIFSSDWGIATVKTIQIYLEEGENMMEVGGYTGIFDGGDNLPNLDKFVISASEYDILKPELQTEVLEREAEDAEDYIPNGDSANRGGFSGGKGASTEEMSPLVYDNIIVPESGIYSLIMDYATAGDRALTVQVNEQAAQDLNFKDTKSWGNNPGDAIGHRTIYVYLNKGNNTIRLFKNGETCPPLDKFVIQSFLPGGIPSEHIEGIQKGTLPASISLINYWSEEQLEELAEKLDGTQTFVSFDLIASVGSSDIFAEANPNSIKYFNGGVTAPSDWINTVEINYSSGIQLKDGYDFNNIRSYFAESISYERDFSGMDGWASLCLPFSYEIGEDEVVEEFSEFTGTSIKFTDAAHIEANSPYLLQVTSETGIKEFISGSQIIPVTSLTEVIQDNYVFKGNYQYIPGDEISANMYLLTTDGAAFARGSSASYVSSFRAYIEGLEMNMENPLLSIVHSDEGTTGIIENKNSSLIIYQSGEGLEIISDKVQSINIYSLDGCNIRNIELQEGSNRVNGISSGIYLINNQKVVLK